MGEHRNTFRGYIAMLVVIKPYRGRGIATELVTRSIKVMMESGCEELKGMEHSSSQHIEISDKPEKYRPKNTETKLERKAGETQEQNGNEHYRTVPTPSQAKATFATQNAQIAPHVPVCLLYDFMISLIITLVLLLFSHSNLLLLVVHSVKHSYVFQPIFPLLRSPFSSNSHTVPFFLPPLLSYTNMHLLILCQFFCFFPLLCSWVNGPSSYLTINCIVQRKWSNIEQKLK
ncbi:uncharacterized protein LOC113863075 isoform X1 [Abrus precatorius]|uniref:Uncharacterized protein LOC113863075 isoform X1 n=1 Tax=Abrus precatorius TaxID=3816 RepID=A0A8B8LC16_ABRPR|nr:uncharacterized protein LOC113863075 isoform X1 [Abrus precatorius]